MPAKMLASSARPDHRFNISRSHSQPTTSDRRPHSDAERGSEVLRQSLVQHLTSDGRLGFERLPFRVSWGEGGLALDGEVSSIAVKRRTIERAASHPSVGSVVDRLRVTPATWMSDSTIREYVVDSLIEEAALPAETVIRKRVRGGFETVQASNRARGEVTVSVEDGVVTLAGELPTRAHKRLAGVLAWWVPGTRDVVDALGVAMGAPDDDAEITAAVHTALEKDPSLDAEQIRVVTEQGVVTLSGLVWSRHEREIAENDAWFVFGVADVVNALQVAELG
jgi:osmotically-inducible protein OsmY